MLHDPPLRARSVASARPPSAVSAGTGLAGLAGLIAWLAIAGRYGMDGPFSALVGVAACGLPMVAWSLLVDKVHRAASTGIDWSRPRPFRDSLDISLTKLAGLWLTWAGIAAVYATGRFYWTDQHGPFPFAMWVLTAAAPALFVASIPYMLWIDCYLVEPRDGCWALGAWAMGLDVPTDAEAIWNHLRGWAVKAFFLAFMLAVVPGGFGQFVAAGLPSLTDPVALASWLITGMFVIDVAFATAGYILAARPLDSHIRTANPHASAWTAALICYPPFVLMANGGPLDYHPGTADWTTWLAGHPVLLGLVGAALVVLTAVYAWATVAFGLRFSNLTHRGILTHGPYAWSRHPAYLSKNLFWWLSTMPMLATTGGADAMRNTAIMALVSGVYWWRAKTEERHLSADPAYRAYDAWIERAGWVPRLFAKLRGSGPDRARVTSPEA